MFGSIEVRGARENNLKGISLDIPKRQLTVFSGVSGSGKSSLVFGTIAAESQRLLNETYTAFVQSFLPSYGRPDVDSLANLSAAIIVDQQRMGGSSRSTVGTATDAYSMLRILFARLGEPNLGTMSVLGYRLRGVNISEVLRISVAAAAEFFTEKAATPMLASLTTVGLDYTTLGQPLSSLSGGSGSGSRWRSRWPSPARRVVRRGGRPPRTPAQPLFWTSPPAGCTCMTWTTWSGCSTGWSTRATR